VQVDLLLPPGVQQPSAVAFVGDGGERFNQDYTTRMEGDQLVVSFSLSTLSFQLEYYAPLSSDATGLREYTYNYTADYAISSFSLEVQVPSSAEAFAMDPAADSSVQGSDGLTYQTIDVGPLAQGDSRSWTITYQKADSGLTVDTLTPAQPAAQQPAAPAQGSDNSTVIIFTLSFIALVAVGASAFWLGKHTQPASPAHAGSRSKGGRGGGRGSSRQQMPRNRTDGGGALFCHQCGASLRSDSEFCHKCGAQVRDS
jgi:hypothetical protein